MKSKVFVGACVITLAGVTAHAGDEKEALQVLHDAKLSLTDAIAIAEKEGNGKAIDAEIEAAKAGHGQYAIEVLSNDGKHLTEYKLNSNTGKVEGTSNEEIEKLLTRVKAEDVRNAQTSLSTAIRTAERQSGGKVIDAETEGNANTLHYELKVATADGKTNKIKIDGSSGKVASK